LEGGRRSASKVKKKRRGKTGGSKSQEKFKKIWEGGKGKGKHYGKVPTGGECVVRGRGVPKGRSTMVGGGREG